MLLNFQPTIPIERVSYRDIKIDGSQGVYRLYATTNSLSKVSLNCRVDVNPTLVDRRGFVSRYQLENIGPQFQSKTNSSGEQHCLSEDTLKRLQEDFELALKLDWSRKPKGYWTSIENLSDELERLIERYNAIPSTSELRKKNNSSLIKAMADFGGRKVLSDVMGVRAKRNKMNIHFEESSTCRQRNIQWYKEQEKELLFKKINCLREALSIISFQKYGVVNRIPSLRVLEKMNLQTIANEIEELGGIARVASLINFTIGEKDFHELRAELMEIGSSLGHRFPTMKELNDMGRSDLRRAIALYGGVSIVSQRIGLPVVIKAGRRTGDHSVRKPQRLWSNEQLFEALRSIEKDTNIMPSAKQLASNGRYDILYQIRARGGHRATASLLGLKLRRAPKYFEN
eukprot:jgi/Galph1/127/GphlegSOOS_G4868.1